MIRTIQKDGSILDLEENEELNKILWHTTAHILAANIDNYYLNKDSLNKKTAFVDVYILDKTTSEVLTGTGTITKGSKVVTVQATTSGWVDGNYVTSPVKFKKGHVYEIGAKDINWGDGKTVTVK